MPAQATASAHRHEVQFYADDAFLADGVATYIGNGLERGLGAIVIATFQHWQAIETRLALRGVDVGGLIEQGRLIYADAGQTLARFMVDGLPDAQRFAGSVAELVKGMIARFPGLCAYGEMVDLLSAAGNHSGTLALEELWNRLLATQPAHLLCGYRLDRFDREAHRDCFRHICHAHTHVFPTEEFTRIDDGTVGEVQRRAIAELQQQAAALRSEVESRRRAEADLERKAEDLARTNEQLQRFAYVAAHDLQEPLRMVTQYLDLVQLRGAGALPADLAKYVGHAVQGANRMRDLIDALLAYEHIGDSALRMVAVDTQALVSEACRPLAEDLAAAGAHLSFAELPTVAGDPAKLGLVFRCLLENALRYRSPAPLQISISAVRDGGSWVFAVRDNGIGVDPAHHQSIFGVFQRLHRHETIPGTGMGLAICRRVVEQHGGRLWLESSRGLGATFCFSLPSDHGAPARPAVAMLAGSP